MLLARSLRAPGKLVVLKRALPHLTHEPTIRDALLSEARWTRSIQSPHVVRLLDLLNPDGEVLLVMEYVHGVSLAYLLDALTRDGHPPEAPVMLRILRDALSGLAAMHDPPRGPALVHGDLNPRNVMVGLDGTARVCDLGLAGPERTALQAEFRGTAAYTAPEVWQGTEQTRRSDVFSAGVMLWEVLRGQRLFRGDGLLATLHNVLEAPIPPLDLDRPDLTPIAAAVGAALQRSPPLRPASAQALRASLDDAPTCSREQVTRLVQQRAGRRLEAVSALGATRPGDPG